MASIPTTVLAARHRLLPEIGDAGVARLAASEASVTGLSVLGADVARAYLERAAVTVTGRGHGDEPVAEAHLRGALFALEHVAGTVGLSRPAIRSDALLEVVRER